MKPADDVVKARLWCLEKNAWSVDLQFNPEAGSMSLARGATWRNAGSGADAWGGPLEFEDGQPDTLSFRILFDETTVGPPDPADAMQFQKAMLKAASALLSPTTNDNDVLVPIQKLLRLTMPIKPAGSGKDVFDIRPPICAFVWDRFEFMGAITNVTTDFLLVDEAGAVRRAACNVTMEGRAFSGTTTLAAFLAGDYKPVAGSASAVRKGPKRDDILKILK